MGAMDLAIRLWTWRTKSDLTLQQVADRSGVSLWTINKVERGLRDLPTQTLRTITEKAFRIDLEKFFGKLPKVRPPIGRAGRPRTVTKPVIGARAA